MFFDARDEYRFLMNAPGGKKCGNPTLLVWLVKNYGECVVGGLSFREKVKAGKRIDKWITVDDITFLACMYIANIRKWKETSDADGGSEYELPADYTEDDIEENFVVTDACWNTEIGRDARAALLETMQKRGKDYRIFFSGTEGQNFYDCCKEMLKKEYAMADKWESLSRQFSAVMAKRERMVGRVGRKRRREEDVAEGMERELRFQRLDLGQELEL